MCSRGKDASFTEPCTPACISVDRAQKRKGHDALWSIFVIAVLWKVMKEDLTTRKSKNCAKGGREGESDFKSTPPPEQIHKKQLFAMIFERS